jgi:hypothetical protein
VKMVSSLARKTANISLGSVGEFFVLRFEGIMEDLLRQLGNELQGPVSNTLGDVLGPLPKEIRGPFQREAQKLITDLFGTTFPKNPQSRQDSSQVAVQRDPKIVSYNKELSEFFKILAASITPENFYSAQAGLSPTDIETLKSLRRASDNVANGQKADFVPGEKPFDRDQKRVMTQLIGNLNNPQFLQTASRLGLVNNPSQTAAQAQSIPVPAPSNTQGQQASTQAPAPSTAPGASPQSTNGTTPVSPAQPAPSNAAPGTALTNQTGLSNVVGYLKQLQADPNYRNKASAEYQSTLSDTITNLNKLSESLSSAKTKEDVQALVKAFPPREGTNIAEFLREAEQAGVIDGRQATAAMESLKKVGLNVRAVHPAILRSYQEQPTTGSVVSQSPAKPDSTPVAAPSERQGTSAITTTEVRALDSLGQNNQPSQSNPPAPSTPVAVTAPTAPPSPAAGVSGTKGEVYGPKQPEYSTMRDFRGTSGIHIMEALKNSGKPQV